MFSVYKSSIYNDNNVIIAYLFHRTQMNLYDSTHLLINILILTGFDGIKVIS